MSASRDLFLRKFRNLLQTANDEDLFRLVWAVHALQSGREEVAGRYIRYPKNAVTKDLYSEKIIPLWIMETVLNEGLSIPKRPRIKGKINYSLDCNDFSCLFEISRLLIALENSCDGVFLKNISIFREINRLAQRQFGWQRGFVSYAQSYRFGYVYGGPIARNYFQDSYGISFDDFSYTCFAFWAACLGQAFISKNYGLCDVGITDEMRDATLRLIAMPHAEATRRAKALRVGGHIAYRKSLLREFPMIVFGGTNQKICAPLPDLIMARSTQGIFYDVISGGGSVRRELGERFELYVIDLFNLMLPDLELHRSFVYGEKQRKIESVDIIIGTKNINSLLIECKAVKMSYEAKFSPDPIKSAERGYSDLVKAVIQIWRFVANARLRRFDHIHIDENPTGMVLTLERFMI